MTVKGQANLSRSAHSSTDGIIMPCPRSSEKNVQGAYNFLWCGRPLTIVKK